MASILVVEDESLLAMEIKAELEDLGYEVPSLCSSGDEAIANVLSYMPDLVLMDICIEGDRDGIDTASYIHEKFSIPVVYLTAYSDPDTISKAKDSHAYGYLLKPFNESALQASIEMALSKAESDRTVRKSELELSNILKSIHGGVIVADFKGVIKYINDQAADIVKLDNSGAVGKSLYAIFKLYNSTTNEKIPVMYENIILNGNSIKESNILFEDARGQRKNINFNLAPFHNINGMRSGLILYFYEL